jgi:Protein of unknown function (DUF3300)/Chaperone of endosialidase
MTISNGILLKFTSGNMAAMAFAKSGLGGFVMRFALLVAAFGGGVVHAEDAGGQQLPTQRIEQLVAPIALYPDDLVSQILMASTYPLEVVEAARWVKENPKVTGQALEDAMQKQPWDPSVKALAALPQTLQMMNDELKWTQDLGDAFLAQQSDVLDAIQRLRARADVTGNLKSTPQQRVTRTSRPSGSPSSAPRSAYVIEPASPDEYYVPVYDPGLVYGAWPYATYRPFHWYPPGYVATGVFGFATGVAVGAAIWGNVNWWNRRVDINVNRYNQFNRTRITNGNWQHNSVHRRGVAYGNAGVAARYGDKGKARDTASQKVGQGKGGMGGKAQGGMGKGGMASGGMGKGGMASGGMGKGGMASGGMGKGGMTSGGMGKGGMASGGMASGGMAGMGGGMAGMGGMAGGGARGGGGMRGGGRRSDIVLKHDIALLGYLNNGIGFYRFAYNGSETAYVGVMAQDVQRVMPEAVVRGRDGYLRVYYDKLGLRFQTYDQWLAAGARVPSVVRRH